MIGNNSVQIILGDQEETVMSHKSSGDDGGSSKKSARKYGKPSADYNEVALNGLRRPANDNGGGSLSPKAQNLLKIVIPVALALGFLAWF